MFESQQASATSGRKDRSGGAPEQTARGEGLASIVDKAISDAAGDLTSAAKAVTNLVRKDTSLFREVMSPLVETACYELVSKRIRDSRRQISDIAKECQSAVAGAARLEAASKSMLDFPLPGGKALRDATAVDCREGGAFYQKQAGDMATKARWLKDIARRLPPGKTVGDVMTNVELMQLFKKAEA